MRSRSPVLILTIGVALAGLVVLNVAMSQVGKPPEPPQEAAQAAVGNDTPGPQAAPSGAPGELAELPPDHTVGPDGAVREVVVGWSWTPEVQADPNKVAAALRAVTAARPPGKVRFVNTDVHPNVPRGVSVDGRKIADLEPDGSVNPMIIVRAAAGVNAGPPGPPPGVPGP
jgi:hypothetical protein